MITVIIPTYNRGNKLLGAVESVLNQTYKDIELLVVDDGSTDNTESIIKNIQDSRVKYIWQENKGACVARNTGIKAAKGKYIAFNDSDDVWMKDKLEKELDIIEKYNADVVFCKITQKLGNKYYELPRKLKEGFQALPVKNLQGIGTQSLLFKREVLTEFKFDEKIPRFQELDLLLRISESKKFTFYFLNESLVNYEVGIDSISKSGKKLEMACEHIEKSRKNFKKMYPEMSREWAGIFYTLAEENITEEKLDLCLRYIRDAYHYETDRIRLVVKKMKILAKIMKLILF